MMKMFSVEKASSMEVFRSFKASIAGKTIPFQTNLGTELSARTKAAPNLDRHV